VTPDATYIAVVESNPPIHGEIRASDTLKLVFDNNIDSLGYSSTSDYYFHLEYEATPSSWSFAFFDGPRTTVTVSASHGRISASVTLSRIPTYADTAMEPALMYIRLHEQDGDRHETICWKLLEYRLVHE